jgi:glycosyltransferase involved in cell wall biosynthesis
MKVLHVITGLSSGGAETQLGLLLEHVRHAPEVLALYNVGRVGQQIAERGIRVYDLGMRSNRQVSRVFSLAGHMRRGRYDLVHVHLYRACIYGRIAARMAGVPVVLTTEHSIGDTQIEGRKKTGAVRALYLATDRFSAATVAVSPRVRERLADWGVPEQKIRVVPNGVDFERFAFDASARKTVRSTLGISPEDFVVGSVGRLHPYKRYDALIRAAEPLLKRRGWLVLVGEGQEKRRLQQVAREVGCSRRVLFVGERPDVSGFLSAMDLFVAPSREETFGLAVLEALSVGVETVFAACPALDGVQVSGAHRTSGDVGELRRILLRQYDLGPTTSEPDQLVRRLYDIKRVANALDELYECLLAGQSRLVPA